MKGYHVIVEQLNVFMIERKVMMKETVHPFLNSHVVVEPQNDILFNTLLYLFLHRVPEFCSEDSQRKESHGVNSSEDGGQSEGLHLPIQRLGNSIHVL